MMLQLGVRAHDFGKLPLAELASRIATQSLTSVQFAPTKAVAGFDQDAGRLSPGFAVACRDTLARHGVGIAVLGCYINLADPDEKRRRLHLNRFREYLRHARDFGCPVVATETGSLNADFSWHPENHGEPAYQTVLAGVRELVAEAGRCGATVCIEGVERYVIHDPRSLRRLLDDVASDQLQILLDPVNLLNARNAARQDEIIAEAFDLLADRIAVLHLKDFVVDGSGFRSVAAGTPGGQLHTGLVLRRIRELKPGIQILLEDTQPETVAASVGFVRDAYARA